MNSSFSAREGDNVVLLVISKSGETQDDIDVIVSLSDNTALGKVTHSYLYYLGGGGGGEGGRSPPWD